MVTGVMVCVGTRGFECLARLGEGTGDWHEWRLENWIGLCACSITGSRQPEQAGRELGRSEGFARWGQLK